MPAESDNSPYFSGPDLEYQAFLANKQFKIQHCGDCDQHVFYPRLLCPRCGADNLTWVDPSGDGEVYSTSVPRGAKEGDYNVALIDLAEGPRLLSRVEGIEPDAVKIGMKVKAFVGDINGHAVVLFKPSQTR